MSAARDEILARIRGALQDVPAGERPDDVPVERAYRRSSGAAPAALIERLTDRLSAYGVLIREAPAGEVARVVAAACADRGARRLLVPAGLPDAWLPGDGAITPVRDDGLSYAQIQEADGVLTGCSVAIAETGTIVLDAGPGQGRRALTLLPDYHLCVVHAGQIVGLVPEAIAHLAGAVRQDHRPITFISGPSATADIEFERVQGVHGPRTLEVILTR